LEKGLGQYDLEYAQCTCFWGINPGKYVKKLVEVAAPGAALDLGAGEGKNSIFLAQQSWAVTAVECSTFALRNMQSRLSEVNPQVRARIEVVHSDVRQFIPRKEFDAVIAYGLLHCLTTLSDIESVVAMMQRCTKPGGINVVVALTRDLPVPGAQAYLELGPIQSKTLGSLYCDWDVIYREAGVITEVHPTSNLQHEHSIVRMLCRKNERS
jgi:ubiquinone/menaquinone biosynthesis C-methylase UbiE